MAPTILQVLEEVYRQPVDGNSSRHGTILKCFASWAQVFDKVEPESMMRSQLFKHAFEALAQKNTFSDAIESIIKVIILPCDLILSE